MSSSILELQTGGRTKENVNSSAGSLQPSKLLYKLKQMAEQYRPNIYPTVLATIKDNILSTWNELNGILK